MQLKFTVECSGGSFRRVFEYIKPQGTRSLQVKRQAREDYIRAHKINPARVKIRGIVFISGSGAVSAEAL